MTPPGVSRDAALSSLAGGQRTIVAHEQLIALGYERRTIARWTSRGRLQPVFHGVYSVVRGELPPLAREQAALLACGEHAFLSHHTAAFIWGLRKWHPADVEVSVAGRYRASSKGIRVHRIREIDRRELRHHEGLWVSSPARAVLEIAATLSPGEVAYAIDEGLARKVLNRRELDDVLARHRGRRGAGRLAAVLADGAGTTITRSRAERAFRKLIRDARLPEPLVNQPFGRWEIDFMWPAEKLVVEIDGYPFHSGPRAFHRDRDKHLALQDAGHYVFRFTPHHVIKEGPVVLARVAAELARRAVSDQ
jgi:very-short-patch-repair endonuclease